MKTQKNKILIVGGYGSVGKVIAKILANKLPNKVIIAGRSLEKAQNLIQELDIQALACQVDISASSFPEINFKEVHTAICCIEFLQNDNFIRACIKNKVNYTELATSYEAYQRFIVYAQQLKESEICLIPGVGLMPGLSGIFVQEALTKLKHLKSVQSYVLLGLGENHGLDAIRFMMESADKTFFVKTVNGKELVSSFTDPVKEKMLNENHSRKFYRFDLGDQHIIADLREVTIAETRLAFDSKFITWFIGILKKIGLLKKLSKVNPKTLQKWLARFQFGSDRFTVQSHCKNEEDKEIIYLAEGFNEAHATGVIATYAVLQLYHSKLTGIKRLEEIIPFNDFVEYLKKNQINIKIKER